MILQIKMTVYFEALSKDKNGHFIIVTHQEKWLLKGEIPNFRVDLMPFHMLKTIIEYSF